MFGYYSAIFTKIEHALLYDLKVNIWSGRLQLAHLTSQQRFPKNKAERIAQIDSDVA